MDHNNSKIQNIYRLAPVQEGILYQYLLDPASRNYFIQMSFSIGKVNVDTFKKTINALADRYDILRVAFLTEKVSNPVQVVMRDRQPEFTFLDYSHLKSDAALTSIIQKAKDDDIVRGFDLLRDSLFRFCLIKFGGDQCHLIWSTHHIIMDGWCFRTLAQELVTIYQSFEKALPLRAPVAKPYWNYIAWVEKQNIVEARNYWCKYLDGFNNKTPILGVTRSFEVRSIQQRTFKSYVGEERTSAMATLAAERSVTTYSVIKAIWSILLCKYNSNADVVFGSVVSGRPSEVEGIDSMIGLFINTLPVRVQINMDDPFTKIVDQIQSASFEEERFQYLSMAEVQNQTPIKGELFDHILVFENYPDNFSSDASDVDTDIPFLSKDDTFDQTFDQTHYPLTLVIAPANNILLKFQYQDPDDSSRVERLAGHVLVILDQVLNNPSMKIGDVRLMDERDLARLESFEVGESHTNSEISITGLFTSHLSSYGDRIALSYGDQYFSYSFTDELIDRAAYYIQNKFSLTADDIVAASAPRSAEMIIAIMGIIRAGGAYLPIDPSHPADRISYLIANSGAKGLLVADEHYQPDPGAKILVELIASVVPSGAAANLVLPGNRSGQGNNAYVIYTSGSTGSPKGVLVSQRGVVNRIAWMQAYCNFNVNDVILHKTSFTFDVSVWEIFASLCYGARMVICPDDVVYDSAALKMLIMREHVTITHFVPTLLNEFLQKVDDGTDELRSLRHVVCSGETLQRNTAQLYFQKINASLHNLYGPTEASVDVSFYEVKKSDTVLPIGAPIWNTTLSVRDECGKRVPVGVDGEIYIGGIGLAEGYLNNPELTHSSFVYDLYAREKTLYRTGDIGKWSEKGQLVFLGRRDDQIKIRGQRVELQEIEGLILQHPMVREAAARYSDGNNGTVTAYIICMDDLKTSAVMDFLKTRLPAYMIPSSIVEVQSMPRTKSGKIDRKKLPDPVAATFEIGYEAPRTRVEKLLTSIMEDVLEMRPIGRQQSFFDLGGHSLKAIRMVAQVKKHFDQTINVRDIFANPTVQRLSEKLRTSPAEKFEKIQPVEEQDHYAVTSFQKGIWVTSQMPKAKSLYTLVEAIRIKDLEVDNFIEAFQQLFQAHESLRTTFVMVDGSPRQKILSPNEQLKFDMDEVHDESDVTRIIGECNKCSFDLSVGPLVKVKIIKTASGEQYFVGMIHHIITDPFSLNVLMNELLPLYKNLGKQLKVAPNKSQFKDYTVWQNNRVQQLEEQKKFWAGVFGDGVPSLELPVDFPRQENRSFNGRSTKVYVDQKRVLNLRRLSKEIDATMFSIVTSLLNALLYCYTGQTDIVLGTPIAGRAHADLESEIGPLLNNIPLRTTFGPEMSFKDLLQKVKHVCYHAFDNSEYPYDLIVQDLGVSYDPTRLMRLFDIVVVYAANDTSRSDNDNFGGVFERKESVVEKVATDLRIAFQELPESIVMTLDYSTDLFTANWAEQFYKHFFKIMDMVVEKPHVLLKNIDFVTDEEKLQIESDNKKVCEIPYGSLTELFQQTARKSQNAVALVCAGQQFTYAFVDDLSDRIGRHLRSKLEIVADDIIAVITDKSEWTIISMLAIMKAGASYLPIDYTLPPDRKVYMIEDANAKALLCCSWLLQYAEGMTLPMVAPDMECNTAPSDAASLNAINTASDAAYVLFTSGSTGLPKAVMVDHKGPLNMALELASIFGINQSERFLQFSNYSFDASIAETFTAFATGAALVINSEELMDARQFVNFLKSNAVTAAILPPSYLAALDKNAATGLKKIITAGENAIVKDAVFYASGAEYYNAYGPTECSVCVSAFRLKGDQLYDQRIPVGEPLANTQVYILDKEHRMLPVGIEGEITVSGAGLARGYLNRPELTREKMFIHAQTGKRMYSTGDLGRRLQGGDIDIVGRNDQQVKLRGYRIELQEIERVLQLHPQIAQAVVVKKGMGNNASLFAYIMARNLMPSLDEIKSWLRIKLPEYMVPTRIISVDEYPLNANRKIDRAVLAKRIDEPRHRAEPAPAITETETGLMALWEEMLKTNVPGAEANFFELGGQSLKAIQCLTRIHERFDVQIDLGDFFLKPTIRELASIIDQAAKSAFRSIPLIEEQDHYGMTYAQLSLWYQNQMIKGVNPFIIHQVFEVNASIDCDLLRQSLLAIMSRHESLRTTFTIVDGEPRQKINTAVESVFFRKAVAGFDHADIRKDYLNYGVASNMDIRNGPLIHLSVVSAEDTEYLVFSVHHILVDAESVSILVSELLAQYKALQRAEEIALTKLPIQFKDFSAWYNAKLLENSDREFCLKELASPLPESTFPTDHPRMADVDYSGSIYSVSLDRETSAKCKALWRRENGTIFTWGACLVNILLYKNTGKTDLIIGSPVSGRDHRDLENQIGYFINSVAIRNRFSPSVSMMEMFRQVNTHMGNILRHQRYPIEKLIDDLQLPRAPMRSPLYDVLIKTFSQAANATDGSQQDGLSNLGFESGTSKYDIGFNFVDTGDNSEIDVIIEYNDKLYERETITRLADQLVGMAQNLLDNPDERLLAEQALTPVPHFLENFLKPSN